MKLSVARPAFALVVFFLTFVCSSMHGASRSVTVGQSVTFSVTASGTTPFTYQWYKNGNAIGGAVNASYNIAAVAISDSGNYSAVVSNTAGSTTSDLAILAVAGLPVVPTITSQPAAQTVTAGLTVSFSVAATGSGPLSYQWMKNGSNIFGATISTFTIAASSLNDAGSYSVAVGNSAGSVTSVAALLTVNAAPVAPSITLQPASQSVTAGQAASFSVAAIGSGPLTYQWKKNGTNIGGATSATYSLSNISGNDAGTYSAVVTNSVGSVTSAAVTLTVSPAPVAPLITSQPRAQSVTIGQSVTFTVAATGTTPLSYQWKKGGVSLGSPSSPSLTIASVTNADAGVYSVLITNSVGSVSSVAVTLTVNAAPVAPLITAQPAAQSVTAGESASFSVGATGSGTLSYQWKKNGVNLVGATSPVLTIASTAAVDTGNYSVIVTNLVGTASSVSVSLTVNAAPVAPSITTQPAAQSVTAGAAVSFSVSAAGSGSLSYQWKKNSANIPGANSSTLTIASASTDDSGGYSVVVSNSAGSVTSAIVSLMVSPSPVLPTITVQPLGKTAAEGDSVSFSVGATGSDPLTYQWKKTGANIAGATSATYTIPSVVVSDGGLYSVTVTNPVGSVTSTVALLIVTPAPSTPGVPTTVPAPPPSPPPTAPSPTPLFVGQYTAADVGSVASSGSTAYDNAAQAFTLSAAGSGIGGDADSFYFASAPTSGNFSITTKLTSFTASKTDAVAGIMIRESSAATAASASIVVTASGTVKFVRRLATNTAAKMKAGRSVAVPVYLRLTRIAGIITADYSSNGADWATLGCAETTMSDAVQAGLVSASSSKSATTVAKMSAPSITSGIQPTIVSGLQLFDIGTSGAKASVSLSTTTISLSGLGHLLSGTTREGVAFLARHNTVDCSIAVNVLPAHLGIPPARAGLMIRENLLDNSPQVTLALNAHGQAVFEYRATSGGFASTQTSSETARRLLLDRRGSNVTAMVSVDGTTWRTIGTAKVSFRTDPWVGLATVSSWWTTPVTVDYNSFSIVSH